MIFFYASYLISAELVCVGHRAVEMGGGYGNMIVLHTTESNPERGTSGRSLWSIPAHRKGSTEPRCLFT